MLNPPGVANKEVDRAINSTLDDCNTGGATISVHTCNTKLIFEKNPQKVVAINCTLDYCKVTKCCYSSQFVCIAESLSV